MNFTLYIAKRYAFSKSKSKAINIITVIASMGIVVSAMAMFVVLSVFGGLREFSLSFTHEIDPELKVFSAEGKYLTIKDGIIQDLEKSGMFTGTAKVVEEQVLFLFKEKQIVAYIKGVDEDYNSVSPMAENVLYGQWLEAETQQSVVGIGVAYRLSMGLFDTENAFQTYAIKPGKGAIDNPQQAFVRIYLQPVGIYSLKNEELDDKYVYVTDEIAQELLSLQPEQYSNIELKMAPGVSEKQAIEAVRQAFKHQEVTVKNRIQLNEGLYRMLNTENLVVYLVVTLVMIIALFTIIGAMIMIILEKQPNMKTLGNLGFTLKQIRKVFLLQGLIISFLGGLLGVVLGMLVVFLQQRFGLVMLTSELAYPVVFSLLNILLVLVTVFVLGFLASWLASSRVNREYLS